MKNDVGYADNQIPVTTGIIEESIDQSSAYQTVTQRYYTPYYKVDEDRSRHQDLCLLVHSNRVTLVCLAPSHPIIERQLAVLTVNCEVSKTLDRKSNKAVGKGKKGGQSLEPTSILCFLETAEESFAVQALAPSKLICMNRIVLSQPSLARDKPDSTGHLAVLLPYLGQIEECKAGLLTKEQYEDLLLKEKQ
jgi:hypothetical protein